MGVLLLYYSTYKGENAATKSKLVGTSNAVSKRSVVCGIFSGVRSQTLASNLKISRNQKVIIKLILFKSIKYIISTTKFQLIESKTIHSF